MLSGAGSSPMLAKAQITLHSNPLEAIKVAEQILNGDSANASAHKLLAEAALAAELPKTAVLSLEIVTKNSPKDEESLKNLARAYSAAGMGEKAEMVISELMRQHPGDLRLADELKDISARKTLAEGGYEALSSGTGSYRDILKDKEQAILMEQEGRQVKSEDIAQLQIAETEAKLAKEPKNLKLVRTLAELYMTKKDFDRALEAYNKIVEIEGAADSSLQKLIAETTIKKFEHGLAQLDPQAPDFAEKSAQITAQRDQFALTECKQRVDHYPGDLGIRFEMGELLSKPPSSPRPRWNFRRPSRIPTSVCRRCPFWANATPPGATTTWPPAPCKTRSRKNSSSTTKRRR